MHSIGLLIYKLTNNKSPPNLKVESLTLLLLLHNKILYLSRVSSGKYILHSLQDVDIGENVGYNFLGKIYCKIVWVW